MQLLNSYLHFFFGTDLSCMMGHYLFAVLLKKMTGKSIFVQLEFLYMPIKLDGDGLFACLLKLIAPD